MPAQKINYTVLSDTVLSVRKIKMAIAHQGLTQEKIAKRMGVTQSTVSYWISDIDRISVGNLKRLCRILSVSPAEILKGE